MDDFSFTFSCGPYVGSAINCPQFTDGAISQCTSAKSTVAPRTLTPVTAYARENMYLRTLTPQRQVSESGLRFLDPELGRWCSRDPIGEMADANLYDFAARNPVSRWDARGLTDQKCCCCPEDVRILYHPVHGNQAFESQGAPLPAPGFYYLYWGHEFWVFIETTGGTGPVDSLCRRTWIETLLVGSTTGSTAMPIPPNVPPVTTIPWDEPMAAYRLHIEHDIPRIAEALVGPNGQELDEPDATRKLEIVVLLEKGQECVCENDAIGLVIRQDLTRVGGVGTPSQLNVIQF